MTVTAPGESVAACGSRLSEDDLASGALDQVILVSDASAILRRVRLLIEEDPELAGLRVGDPGEKSTQIGPLISARQRDRGGTAAPQCQHVGSSATAAARGEPPGRAPVGSAVSVNIGPFSFPGQAGGKDNARQSPLRQRHG